MVMCDGSPVTGRLHGCPNHDRRYTAHIRLLRPYMVQESPIVELTTLVAYVIPIDCVWRQVPAQPYGGTRHLFDQLERQRRYLSGAELKAVQQRMSRNAMIAYPRKPSHRHVREPEPGGKDTECELWISWLRPESTGGRHKFTQRTFRCAELNLGASNYTELVDLRATDIEPPFIVPLYEEELRRCLPDLFQTGVRQGTPGALPHSVDGASCPARNRGGGGCYINWCIRRR